VYRIKWFKDAKALSSQARIGGKAVVIGAGLAGIEMAEALAIKGLKVTIVEKCGSILPQILEPDFAERVTEQIRKKTVEVRLNATISSIGGKEKVNHAIVDGEKIETDVAVFATGFKPNTSLLRDSGIRLSDNMAIKTDEHMETNIDGIYAAGDCAESLDLVTGQNTYRPLGTVAARAGEIAGLNAGGKSSSYGGFIRRQYDRIFGVDIVSMGLTRSLASNLGIRTYDINVHEKRHSDNIFFRTQKMKAIVNEATDTIVGFQVIGSTKYRSWYSLQIQECILKKVKIDALSHMGVKLRPFMN
jgi:NADPH-dependent 2,4-dienoyl-CoA reductase/sulfur reductase-like enzyme